MNGSNSCSGRVEVLYNGIWGTVCDDGWGLTDAAVVCREMGCGNVMEAKSEAYFGQGSGPIWMAYVYCAGTETSLKDCWTFGPIIFCGHHEDAGVICNLPVRLVNGGHFCSGRVEVLYNGIWGTVCDDGWDLSDAAVVCGEMGCGNVKEAKSAAYFGQGSGQIWMDDVNCAGTESSLKNCRTRGWGIHNCGHHKDAGIICNSVRLVNGGHSCSGRVEVLYNGTWGTVCDDYWDLSDAAVVCRELGCGNVMEAKSVVYFGQGSGQIWMDDVNCTGTESSLKNCWTPGWGIHNCGHHKDAGIICNSVRLVNGDSCSGRVEVLHNGTWGTVCDDGWDLSDAAVVCRELGCGNVKEAKSAAYFGQGSGQIWMDDVNCAGTESSLKNCRTRGWGRHDCGHHKDAGVICNSLRLVNGGHSCSGRVEVVYNVTWGTVCDDDWDLSDAAVVCREMGYHFTYINESKSWIDALGYCKTHHETLVHILNATAQEYITQMLQDKEIPNGVWIGLERSMLFTCSPWLWTGGPYVDYASWHQTYPVDRGSRFCGKLLKVEKNVSGWVDACCHEHLPFFCQPSSSSAWSRETVRWRNTHGISSTSRASHAILAPRSVFYITSLREQSKARLPADGPREDFAAFVERVLVNNILPFTIGPVEDDIITSPTPASPETSHPPPESDLTEMVLEPTSSNSHVFMPPAPSTTVDPVSPPPASVPIASPRPVDTSAPPWLLPPSATPETIGHMASPDFLVPGSALDSRRPACAFGSVWLSLPPAPLLSSVPPAQLLSSSYPPRTLVAVAPPWSPVSSVSHGPFGLTASPVSPFSVAASSLVIPREHTIKLAAPWLQLYPGCTTVIGSDIRLVNGDSCSGRVEVLYNGIWGTVCDDGWDLSDAAVVCREMGCGNVIEAKRGANFGQGSGPIWMDDVQCAGNESTLKNCSSNEWGVHNCSHQQDAGVICQLSVRLMNGDSCSGRVEVLYNGIWGTVCDDYWDLTNAAVMCREMGCGNVKEAKSEAYFGQGSGQIWMDDVNCVGTESSLKNCRTPGWGIHDCGHNEDAGVICNTIKLVNGSDSCSGRVEVLYNGTWGTVCDDDWDLSDAAVVCREMGCRNVIEAKSEAYFGQGSGQIWMDDINCAGNESSLKNCRTPGWGIHDCGHHKDAGIICNSVRLVNGSDSCSGRVEVLHNGIWGTVCDDDWDLSDAAVVCREMGCGNVIEAKRGANFGQGSGQIWMDDVQCAGNETTLKNCSSNRLHNCGHQQDAGVICQSVRLVNGSDSCSGRVEFLYKGQWGTVCDDYWDLSDAAVVCREMDCGNVIEAKSEAYFGRGSGQIWMDDVNCVGTESSLKNCWTPGWGRHDCVHDEDTGVICNSVRLVNGDNSCSGRVEVLHNGTWGTVCDDDWDLSDAAVVCREMGCGNVIEAKSVAYFGQGSGQIWMDDVNCAGNESSLKNCGTLGWGIHDCGHHKDAGVICSCEFKHS
ncbi:Deleted in malignant brain tumors 1 protein [Anabarilius grahami]|uniref:Soluble scavenger receptor cysteine-rich domain-containing protein SSC5D n=1 Tax=Anabarilius grahami TaxID=495550 RepID=A0A3N0XFZ9_ANAGA|nr:Deleted in malignant brain tumors 1 protein [Anabarilius grahami]